MYRDRPKSPSITQSTEDTNTLRAAMSLYIKNHLTLGLNPGHYSSFQTKYLLKTEFSLTRN